MERVCALNEAWDYVRMVLANDAVRLGFSLLSKQSARRPLSVCMYVLFIERDLESSPPKETTKSSEGILCSG